MTNRWCLNNGKERFPGQPVSRILSSVGLRFTPAMETIAGFIPEDPALGRSSIWAADLSAARAANPGLECSEQLLVPAWPCSWRGLPGRGHCCPRRWSLTPPFHPSLRLTYPQQAASKLSVWRFVSVARSGRLPRPGSFPGAMLCGVRTFLYRSSDRPTDLEDNDTIREVSTSNTVFSKGSKKPRA